MTTPITEQKNQVFISDNGDNYVYMLFVDKKPPSKHDLLVTDYSGTFISAEDAMDWYDKRYLPYGEPQALIAKYGLHSMIIKYRSIVLGEEDHVPGHPAWAYAYDEEEY